jgi:hypothetical protein
MKSDNEEVAANLCLKYGLRLGYDQRAKGWALTTFLRQAWGSTPENSQVKCQSLKLES